jgi:trans-aconitate methyltransferase
MCLVSVSSTSQHWVRIFESRCETDRSWTEAVPAESLASIDRLAVAVDAPIIDIGGGASRLIDHLLAAGHTDLTVLDVSMASLCQARARVGHDAPVEWIHADITTWSPTRQYSLWHDRAVFHFLVDAAHVRRYGRIAAAAVAPGGHLVMGTFSPDGPANCSGLSVRRWSATDLAAAFAEWFEPAALALVDHHTPSGPVQPFTWVTLRRSA